MAIVSFARQLLLYIVFTSISFRYHLNAQIVGNLSNNCQSFDYLSFKLAGSTTNYDDVRGHGNLSIGYCQAQQVWSIYRHGIRNTHLQNAKIMSVTLGDLRDRIVQAFKAGESQLCSDDINNFKLWRFNEMLLYEPQFLIDSGKEQLKAIGKRMKQHFPSLLYTSYDPIKFEFVQSGTQRTLSSLRAFAEGLFDQDPNFQSQYLGEINKDMTFDCNVLELLPMETRYEDFPPSRNFADKLQLFENIAESISLRTGVDKSYFNETTISVLYECCVYDIAAATKVLLWCNLFTLKDLNMMRHREEYLHYNAVAYGSKYSNKFGCSSLQSLISTFNNTVEGNGNKVLMKAYFGHDATLEMLLTRLGCLKDQQTSYDISRQPAWNISGQTPFAANINGVLYKCSRGDDDHVIQFYLNEKPIGCCMTESIEPCSWTEFRNHLEELVKNCTKDYCDHNSAKYAVVHLKLIWIIGLVYYFM